LKGYKDLSEMVIFTFNDALRVFGQKSTTYAALRRLSKKGFLKKIRNNLYSCVSPLTGSVFADKYQIASNINQNCFVSHHGAFEYYGFQNQVTYVIYVSSSQRFNEFDFEGITYKCVISNETHGVIEPPYSFKTKIADIERTILDAINHVDSITNLEEIVSNLSLIKKVDSNIIERYLDIYHLQSLYQKVGYLFSLFQDDLKIEDDFFQRVKERIHKSVTYLNEESKFDGIYISEYQLVVPKWLEEGEKNDEV
jgi:predicted transcriptional regulator of viral defense system